MKELIDLLRDLKSGKSSVGEKTNIIAQHYKPVLQNKYDDWQKRWKDIEMFIMIAERYKSMREFLNDMAIEPPVESIAELTPESKEEEFLTLSTIHSAKGLEWKAVFLIWALVYRAMLPDSMIVLVQGQPLLKRAEEFQGRQVGVVRL